MTPKRALFVYPGRRKCFPLQKNRTFPRLCGFKRTEEMSKFRRFVTSGVGLTFLVVGATGVLFQFFFKTRPLVQIHAWLGVAMVAAALIHILQNWRSLLSHLRDWRVYLLLIPTGLAIWYVSQHSHREGHRETAGRGPRGEGERGEAGESERKTPRRIAAGPAGKSSPSSPLPMPPRSPARLKKTSPRSPPP